MALPRSVCFCTLPAECGACVQRLLLGWNVLPKQINAVLAKWHLSGQHAHHRQPVVALAGCMTARRCAKVLAGDTPRVSLGSGVQGRRPYSNAFPQALPKRVLLNSPGCLRGLGDTFGWPAFSPSRATRPGHFCLRGRKAFLTFVRTFSASP